MTLLSVMLVTLALTGCGNSLEPVDVVGTYELVSVNGQPLPFSGHIARSEHLTTIVRSTLTLQSGGTGELARWYASQDFPSVLEVYSWIVTKEGRVSLALSAGLLSEGHYDEPWEDGDLTITFGLLDFNPPGVYLYRKQP